MIGSTSSTYSDSGAMSINAPHDGDLVTCGKHFFIDISGTPAGGNIEINIRFCVDVSETCGVDPSIASAHANIWHGLFTKEKKKEISMTPFVIPQDSTDEWKSSTLELVNVDQDGSRQTIQTVGLKMYCPPLIKSTGA